jgi:dTDP-4-dehydrorhamnose reductase
MLLMSSDAVFDGSQPPYTPGRPLLNRKPLLSFPLPLTSTAEHPTSPITPHGKLKVQAEAQVASTLRGAATILRVPVLYGRMTRCPCPLQPVT